MSDLKRALMAVAAALLLALGLPCAAAAAPVTCRVGAYITAIHDVDTVKGTFAAEAWLWSQCPGEGVRALLSMEATSANEARTELHSATPRQGGAWEQQKLTGIFRHDYDLRLFPFDRHRLEIGLEEGTSDIGSVRYVFDAANSGISPDIKLDGWRVTGFGGAVSQRTYRTTFGDPALPPGSRADYAHLDLEIETARANIGSFFKLSFPVYVAAMLALLSLLMFAEEGRAIINSRIAFLAGLVLAVVFNLRSMDELIGARPALTLMDMVHFVALALIVVVTFAAVLAARTLERGGSLAVVKRNDRRLFWWLGGLFAGINAAMLLGALLLR